MHSDAEELKFVILADGVQVTDAAREFLIEQSRGRIWTPNDYASTSGIVLKLEDDVWVNAPFRDNNPNFIAESAPTELDIDTSGSLIVGDGVLRSSAWFCPPPDYHGRIGSNGKPFNNYVFSHGDRVRLSPMQGCGMVCKFCNIPYEDRYGTKPLNAMIEGIETALTDPIQPAQHLLISGGTPKPAEYPYLQSVYREVLTRFPTVDIDIMMVPVSGLLAVEELADLGVHDLSVNLEVVDRDIASNLMRQKHELGLDHYLRFIEHAAFVLGEGRVRSLLMVGLEPMDTTLEGVRLICDAGGVPVLSPFRPDPVTPLADHRPFNATDLAEVFARATEYVESVGLRLGPSCPPCTHNTLTLVGSGAHYPYSGPHPY